MNSDLSNEPTQSDQCILLVDDDPLFLRMIEAYLADYGFRIVTARNGGDGCALAERAVPDLILLDLVMPGIDGFAACEQFKGQPETADIPVIFLTGNDAVEEKKRGFSLGAVDYIVKPPEQNELIARIMVHLNQRRIQRNLQRRLANYNLKFGPLDGPNEVGAKAELPEHRLNNVNEAAEILRNHLVNPPSLEALAVAVNSNAKRLSKDFQILYGMTAFAWLKEYRLQRAAELLRNSQTPISRIADQVSFSGSAKLATSFKARFQLTPRQYRTSISLRSSR